MVAKGLYKKSWISLVFYWVHESVMALTILDKVFLILFARYRRKAGVVDIESSWRRASSKVSAYVFGSVLSLTVLIMVVTYRVTQRGTFIEHKRMGQIIAVFSMLALSFL